MNSAFCKKLNSFKDCLQKLYRFSICQIFCPIILGNTLQNTVTPLLKLIFLLSSYFHIFIVNVWWYIWFQINKIVKGNCRVLLFVKDYFLPSSIISLERKSRSMIGLLRMKVSRGNQKWPPQFGKFFRLQDNKIDLVKFLINESSSGASWHKNVFICASLLMLDLKKSTFLQYKQMWLSWERTPCSMGRFTFNWVHHEQRHRMTCLKIHFRVSSFQFKFYSIFAWFTCF